MFYHYLLNRAVLTAVSGVGSSPALATCKTCQVLLAGVSGGLPRGSPVFAPPTKISLQNNIYMYNASNICTYTCMF